MLSTGSFLVLVAAVAVLAGAIYRRLVAALVLALGLFMLFRIGR